VRAIPVAVLAAVMCLPAGCAAPDRPAATSEMVCADEAQRDISAALGIPPSRPPEHTWSDHVYTCRYAYDGAGALVLSVRELRDPAAAVAYTAGRRAALPGQHTVPGLGDDALAAPDGSTVVRRGTSVVQVDVTGLPDPFGPRRLRRSTVGITVASVIIECWNGP